MSHYQKWNEEIVKDELKKVINDIGHFPTNLELTQVNRSDLIHAIQNNGRINKFRGLLGYKITKKSNNYWSEEKIINELKRIIFKIGHFPLQKEVNSSLLHAIHTFGGINKFRTIFCYEPIKHSNGYWKEDKIIEELKEIINKIGHFPKKKEIRKDLLTAIQNHGDNINKYRMILGYKQNRHHRGYWTDETIIKELKQIISEIGYFPSFDELIKMRKSDLVTKMIQNGGIPKYRKECGAENYYSLLVSYIVRRGRNSEKIVNRILEKYCSLQKLPPPLYNINLSKKSRIEIICNTNKKIGIDVTNTKNNRRCISDKWIHKDYHKYLDELWIVVFSDVFTEQDYIEWNNSSPPNVKVFSIYQFLKELDYSLDGNTKSKIDKYCSCTFHTKEELQNKEGI